MNILFVCHRIPYPPNKGDKIRSFNILRHLAEKHEVYLATLVDDPTDLQYLHVLEKMVRKVEYDLVHPIFKKLSSTLALLRSRPISVDYFYSVKIQKWIDSLLDSVPIDAAFCFSSPIAEYLFRSRHYHGKLKEITRVIDLIDVDSYKWEQYAERSKGIMKRIYLLESRYLRNYEQRIADEFDRVLLVSEAEKALLLDRIEARNSQAMSNGVDLQYFSPSYESPPLPVRGPTLAFTGAMDYWPNIDAVQWFVQHVLPDVLKIFPSLTFYIIGNRPAPAVRRMALEYPCIKVTGYVDDIRTCLARIDVCVAPLRIARGIQNKVLEAMAMGKPVVCTSHALEGICAEPGKDIVRADAPEEFAEAVIQLLKDKARRTEIGKRARSFVENNFSWASNLAPLGTIFQPGQAAHL